MIEVLIVFGFTSLFFFALFREIQSTRRTSKLCVINTALAKMKKNKNNDEKWIPVDDEMENLEKKLEEENREEEADEGDDDAILGL